MCSGIQFLMLKTKTKHNQPNKQKNKQEKNNQPTKKDKHL